MLTRNEYTIIDSKAEQEGDTPAPPPCSKASPAIVVEGPGQRGEIVQVCTDPECEVHGKPDHRAEQEAAARQREHEFKRQQQERQKNQESNRRLLDAVLQHVPKTLTRDDYNMLVFGAIDRFDYEDWDAVIERYKIDTDEQREPDAAAFELRRKAEKATEPELIRMLVEFTLLPSGYCDEVLEFTDPLASAARRYNVSLTPKKNAKPKAAKCAPKPKATGKQPKPTASGNKAMKKAAAQKGGAA